MSKYHFGKSRAYKGWLIQDVYQAGQAGMERSCWQASKNGLVIFADTLAELKDLIKGEEYQYEEEGP
jgi:hypothetical protein